MAATGVLLLRVCSDSIGTEARRPIVLHILPQDGIGGAEIAANTVARAMPNVHLLFLRAPAANTPPPHPRVRNAASSVPFSISTLRAITEAMRQIRPDVVVFSMWKSFAAYAVVFLFFQRIDRVIMLHSDRSVHIADKIITETMIRSCHMVWADCRRTAERAERIMNVKNTRILSFLKSDLSTTPRGDPRYNFVFWGRLSPVKNILTALDLIYELQQRHSDIAFTVIGPDAGALEDLQAKVARLGVSRQVVFLGYRSYDEIVFLGEGSSFFVQLSDQEGMAMSVVEAMQLGLVPVVTPVGEIANYCRHMKNGIIHRDIASTVAAIEQIVADPERYTAMSRAAIETWRDAPLYADDFAAAAAELFARARGGARP